MCHNRFAAKETLNRHVRTHTGRKDHKCLICGKEFIQNTQLRAHMFYHNGENALLCDLCGKQFNRKTRLREHLEYIHLKVRSICFLQKSKTQIFYFVEENADLSHVLEEVHATRRPESSRRNAHWWTHPSMPALRQEVRHEGSCPSSFVRSQKVQFGNLHFTV